MNAQLRRARNRQMFIFLLVCLGIFTLLARLYYWQILQSQSGYKLAQRANDEHIKNLTLVGGLNYYLTSSAAKGIGRKATASFC